MEEEQITQRVGLVFRQVFGARTPFTEHLSRLDEPRWTSLKHVELLISLEKEFGVRFDGADATDMVSVPVVLERLQAKLK